MEFQRYIQGGCWEEGLYIFSFYHDDVKRLTSFHSQSSFPSVIKEWIIRTMTAAYCRWAKLVFLVGLIDCIPSEATKNFQWNLAATLTWDSTLNGRLRIRQHLTAKNRTFSWVLIICFGVPLVAVSSLWCLMSTLQVTCFLQERFSRFKRVVVHLLLFLWMAQWCVGETLEMAETAA